MPGPSDGVVELCRSAARSIPALDQAIASGSSAAIADRAGTYLGMSNELVGMLLQELGPISQADNESDPDAASLISITAASAALDIAVAASLFAAALDADEPPLDSVLADFGLGDFTQLFADTSEQIREVERQMPDPLTRDLFPNRRNTLDQPELDDLLELWRNAPLSNLAVDPLHEMLTGGRGTSGGALHANRAGTCAHNIVDRSADFGQKFIPNFEIVNTLLSSAVGEALKAFYNADLSLLGPITGKAFEILRSAVQKVLALFPPEVGEHVTDEIQSYLKESLTGGFFDYVFEVDAFVGDLNTVITKATNPDDGLAAIERLDENHRRLIRNLNFGRWSLRAVNAVAPPLAPVVVGVKVLLVGATVWCCQDYLDSHKYPPFDHLPGLPDRVCGIATLARV